MGYVGESNSMRPVKGDTSITLPVTFDYNGGGSEYSKTRKLWAIIVSVIGILASLIMLFGGKNIFIVKLFFSLVILFVFSIIVRFVILKEAKIRNRMSRITSEDYKREYRDFWGSYSIEEDYPYYVHLKGGREVLFVLYEKDVIIGKEKDAEFNHYEAIGDALNLLGSMGITFYHIDYMDTVGSDDRLDNCFEKLSSVVNPDIRALLTDVYTNLQSTMEENVTTYDVYAYTFKGSESSFWYNIQKVISCMLDANYSSFKILNTNYHRLLVQSLLNLLDFSVNTAEVESFSKTKGIIPISVVTYNGEETIFNKTSEEKKQDLKNKSKEQELKKLEQKRRKKKKVESVSDNDIDLFN